MRRLLIGLLLLLLLAPSCRSDDAVDVLPFPASPFEGGVSVDQFETWISIDGDRLAFEVISTAGPSATETPFGAADTTVHLAESDGATRRTVVHALQDPADTFVLRHEYTFEDDVSLDGLSAFAVSTDVDGVRLAYGPADNTVYMVEDYLGIPAVEGYSKGGSMLFGGMPLNDAWSVDGGIAVGVMTNTPGTYRLPLEVDEEVALGHLFEPDEALGQSASAPAGTILATDWVFVSYHRGDFFGPTSRYVDVLERLAGRSFRSTAAPASAARPTWKTWGLDPEASGHFTKEQVRDVAAVLEGLGIDSILLDYGWFTAEGNWDVNPDIFSDEVDLGAFVDELRARDFRVGLWFQPLQLDPTDDEVLAGPLLDLAIVDEDGDLFVDDDELHLLDPSRPEVIAYVEAQLQRFAGLGIEHVYLDSQMAQLAAPPNFGADDPLASHRALPQLYQRIRALGDELGLVVEICPDGRSQTLLNMPQHLTNTGDPKNDRQLRVELKSLKAMMGGEAYVSAYVDPFEDNRVSGSFLNILAPGGVLHTMFRDVDDLGVAAWTEALALHRSEDIALGTYLDLYDVGFDVPEGHVVERGSRRYYSFFMRTEGLDVCLDEECEDEEQVVRVEAPGPASFTGDLVLRGLAPGADYSVRRVPDAALTEHTADAEGTVRLEGIAFTKEVLFVLELRP